MLLLQKSIFQIQVSKPNFWSLICRTLRCSAYSAASGTCGTMSGTSNDPSTVFQPRSGIVRNPGVFFRLLAMVGLEWTRVLWTLFLHVNLRTCASWLAKTKCSCQIAEQQLFTTLASVFTSPEASAIFMPVSECMI